MGLSFSTLCRIHAGIDILSGAAMIMDLDKTAKAVHGEEIAKDLIGDAASAKTSEEVSKVRITESLVGVLLVDIGLILGVVATAKRSSFQRNFASVALGTHALMAFWRYKFESKVPSLKDAWKKQLFGDAVMASTWAGFLLKGYLKAE